MLGELQQFGPEPPLEEMSKVFTAVLFGVFSGIFLADLCLRPVSPDPTRARRTGYSIDAESGQSQAKKKALAKFLCFRSLN